RVLPPPPLSTLFPYTTLFRSLVATRNSYGERILVSGAFQASSESISASVIALRSPSVFLKTSCNLATSAGGGSSATKCRTNLVRSEEHTSELQSRGHLVCRLL